MSIESIISMIVILTIVVGGFIYFLVKAIKKEVSIGKNDEYNQAASYDKV